MNKTLFAGIALVAAALLLVLLPGPTDRNAKPPAASHTRPDTLKIETDRNKYSPAMSSTVGIGLTPILSMAGINGRPKFLWKTDHGVFLKWSPPDYRVVRLGRETANTGEKIYWSQDFAEHTAPATAIISLTALWDGGQASSSLKIITEQDGLSHTEP